MNVELPVDMGSIVPGASGTADFVAVSPRSVHIADLKFGKGVAVAAQGNAQLRLYALGALHAHAQLIEPDAVVTMCIVQPRLVRGCREPKIEVMSAAELRAWATHEVVPKAALASAGLGTLVPGAWCRFCRASHVCSAVQRRHGGAPPTPRAAARGPYAAAGLG